jgi:hypothetical protein
MRKIKKVTTSQDDGPVGVLKNILVGCAKNWKCLKKLQPPGMTKERATVP